MKKIILYVLAAILIIGAILYLIPVPQQSFDELYDGDEAIQKSLSSFRQVPTKSIQSGEVDWNYISIGKGENHLLFIHGMGGAYDIWWQQINALKDRFHIISITMPAVHSLDEVVSGIKTILDTENIEKVNLIGSSMGGYIGQYFYQKHPELLNKIVFGNTFPPNDLLLKENGKIRKALPFIPEWMIMKMFRDNLSEKVTPFSEDSPLVEAYLLEQYSGYMSKPQFIGRLDVVLDYFQVNHTALHKDIPILIIESDNDPLIQPVLQQQLKKLYKNAQVFTFKEKGHFPYLNDAKKYTDVLTEFLEDKTEEDIRVVINNYFQGRKTANIDLLNKVFHPQAQLITKDKNNNPIVITLQKYLTDVKKQGAVVCETQLLNIEHKDEVAHVHTSFDYGQIKYLDSLTLYSSDQGWKIKTKHFKVID